MSIDTVTTDRVRSEISRAQEKQIAKSLSPSVAWPTLALAVILPATFGPWVKSKA